MSASVDNLGLKKIEGLAYINTGFWMFELKSINSFEQFIARNEHLIASLPFEHFFCLDINQIMLSLFPLKCIFYLMENGKVKATICFFLFDKTYPLN